MRVFLTDIRHAGLYSSDCFAEFGHGVTLVDKVLAGTARLGRCRIRGLRQGRHDQVDSFVRGGRRTFALDGVEAIRTAAMGGPLRGGDRHADQYDGFHAADWVMANLTERFIVDARACESPFAPIGAGHALARPMLAECAARGIGGL